MRQFIADIYKVFYRLTGIRIISVAAAVVYTSTLNLLTIYGSIFLLNGLVKGITFLLKLFTFPGCIFTITFMLAFNVWLLMPLHNLSKGKWMRPMVAPIIVYSFVALLVFLYSCFFDNVAL